MSRTHHSNMDTASWILRLFCVLLASGQCTKGNLKSKSLTRNPRSTDNGDTGKKCGYTFLVPEQKITGPICVHTVEPASDKAKLTRMDLEDLKEVLSKQKRDIETLQVVVDVDGNIVNEVKLLRKESRNMNSRVTQLYMQLLHEIIRKRDNLLELSQIENKILNATTEMHKMAARSRALEVKYAALIDVVNNQSVLISMLEDQCLKVFARRDRHGSPPLVQVVPQHIPERQQYIPGLLGGNEIQRDPVYPRDGVSHLQPLPASSSTRSPFRVPPVTVINEGEPIRFTASIIPYNTLSE